MTWLRALKWYYLTRGTGLIVLLNEVFLDTASKDRATIIIAAAGLMGLDKVARSDQESKR